MPKCLPAWRHRLTRRIWRKAHMNRLYHISKGSWNWMVWSSRWAAEKYCDATGHTPRHRKTQTNLPPLQNARSLSKPVPQCRQLKRGKDQARNYTNSADNNNNINGGGQTNSNSNNKTSNNTNSSNKNNQKDRKPRHVYPPCETCGKINHSTEKCYFGANAANVPPPQNRQPEGQNPVQQRTAQNNSDMNFQAAAQNLY